MKVKLFLISLVVLVCQTTKAKALQEQEEVTFTGKVINSKNEPVSGAVIFLDTLNTNVISNTRGYFQIKVPNDVKRVSIYSDEYGILAADYSGQKSLIFKYLSDEVSDQLEDKLRKMGYGEHLDKDVEPTVSHIKYKEDDSSKDFANIYEMIKGRIPGVTVTGNKIVIRGVKTLMGSSDPLFVVDGIIRNNIDDIQPNLVKSISVLKGPDATMYGSRGANGVIMINLLN